VLGDGRLGLIDFGRQAAYHVKSIRQLSLTMLHGVVGMVGRLSAEQRANIAHTVLALHAGDVGGVARIYGDSGYRATWFDGEPHGPDAIHRFASFHLDCINLSSVAVSSTRDPRGQMPVMKLLRSTIEQRVPDWVEQARRLGGLLIGVGSQTARPISLSKEWAPLALELLSRQSCNTD
jgi:hypothetical protein